MPGLLDYIIKGYTHGGSVDIDPYADTSMADMLTKLGITITDPSTTGGLPTYDPTGAGIAREAYDLRGEAYGLEREAFGLRSEGLSAELSTARRGGTGSLMDLTRQTQQQLGGSGFFMSGAGTQAMTNVRGDIISGFGDVSADVGRREEDIVRQLAGLDVDERQSYLDLQHDIYGMTRDYERDLLAAVGDLPEGSYRFGTGDVEDAYTAPADPCGGQCSNFPAGSDAHSNCMQACQEGLGGGDTSVTGCPSGYSLVNGRCERDQV